MRKTVTLDEDAYQIAVNLSENSGTPVGKVVSNLLRKTLSNSAPRKKIVIPTFDVPPGTPTIPGNRALELLDEDY
jgi:hypothetical protein